MTDIHSDALLQVQDANERWHAAAVGPGVLCQEARPQQEAATVQTVSWEWGTDRIDCGYCLRRRYELQVAAA